MPELYLTRHNEMVDPALHVWGWEIPIYLFLGGVVAGLMVLSGLRLFREPGPVRAAGPTSSAFRAMPPLGLLLLSLGMLALFLDLEHRLHAWRLYVAFEPTSPMSWGAWILILVYPVLAAAALVHLPAPLARRFPRLERAGRRIDERADLRRALGAASVGLGIGLGAYTGILLSSLGARPMWNSAVLAPLFLTSGLSSAAALGHWMERDAGARSALVRLDVDLLTAELGLVALYLIGLGSGGQAQASAAAALLGGPFTAVFWTFAIGVGIVAPLFIQLGQLAHRVEHAPVAPALVLVGGLALRFVMVHAGQLSRWPSP